MADMRAAMLAMYRDLLEGCHCVPPLPFLRQARYRPVTLRGANVTGLAPLGPSDPVPQANPAVWLANLGPQGLVHEPPSELARPQDSDVSGDAAQEHVLLNLHALGAARGSVFLLSELGWGRYLHDPAWAAARQQWGAERGLFPLPEDLDTPQVKYSHGECDVLVFDRRAGVLLLEVKAIGKNGPVSTPALVKRLKKVIRLCNQSFY